MTSNYPQGVAIVQVSVQKQPKTFKILRLGCVVQLGLKHARPPERYEKTRKAGPQYLAQHSTYRYYRYTNLSSWVIIIFIRTFLMRLIVLV